MSVANQPLNVLFLCTGNSARSIIAESILRKIGGERFRAYSAGSMPAARVNPLTLELLASNGIPTNGLRSKSWEEFSGPNAPPMHFVLTVCDNAAGEICPLWSGTPITAHWGMPDPAAVVGTDEERLRAFETTFTELRRRIALFLSLPHARLERSVLKAKLEAIGRHQ